MEQTYEEFLKDFKKVSGNRVHKIRNSSGMAAAFSFYRQNRPQTSEYVLQRNVFDKIVNEMNLLMIERLFSEKSFNLPCGLGKLYVTKFKNKTFIDDNGNLVCTKPIDTDATFRLWYEDEECLEKKTKVRRDVDYTFRLKYNKNHSVVKNITYFHFKYGRSVKAKLKDVITTDKKFDTYELKQMDQS